MSSGEYDANLAGTNPWRPLPDNPALLATIKETMFLKSMFSYYLSPTSLPGDNYALVSDYLRNLETRSDLSLFVMREVDIYQTLVGLSNRITSGPKAIPEEPFDLVERLKAMHDHWYRFRMNGQHLPPEWDPAFYTTYFPPLIVLGEGEDSPKIAMTEEERVYSDAEFNHYLRQRERKVAYFSKHSPIPMGFKPAPGIDKQAALDAATPGGRAKAGASMNTKELSDKTKFWPMWRGARQDEPPYDWDNSVFESEEAKQDLAIINELDKTFARREKQEEYQRKVAEEYRAKQKEL